MEQVKEHLYNASRTRVLVAAHQQETALLLDANKQLEDDLRETVDKLEAAQRTIDEQKEYIRQLEEKVAQLQGKPTKLFCRITPLAYERGKAQEVENKLSSAAKGSAKKLVEAIHTFEILEYVDTKNLSTTELYDLLDTHYGLKYSLRNFTAARNAT